MHDPRLLSDQSDSLRTQLGSRGHDVPWDAIQALSESIIMFEEQGIPFMSFAFLSDELNQNMHLWNQSLTLDFPILFGIINLLFWPIPFYFLFKKLKHNIRSNK